MNTHKGFGLLAAVLVVAGLFVVAGAGYVVLNQKGVGQAGDSYEQQADGQRKEKGWIELDSSTLATAKTSISWKFTDMDFDADNTPHTEVTAVVNEKEYVVGTFAGSCSEIGATGGIDGSGLLAGELSAVQCWHAGTGDEVGVFAHEDGGYQIMVGELGEGDENSPFVRRNFVVHTDIRL